MFEQHQTRLKGTLQLYKYSKTCLKRPLKNRQNKNTFDDAPSQIPKLLKKSNGNRPFDPIPGSPI